MVIKEEGVDKINQDLRIMQAIVKEAIQQNPDGGINIVNIGQVKLVNSVEEQSLSVLEEKGKLLPHIEDDELCKRILDKENTSLSINVTGSPELFEELKKIASAEMRSVAAQVLQFISEGIRRHHGR